MSFAASSDGHSARSLALSAQDVGALCREWHGQLHAAIERLRQLETSTERDFLKIGGSLQDYSLRSRKASDQARIIASHLSQGNLKAVESDLLSLLEQVRRFLEVNDRNTSVKSENLREVGEEASRIARPLEDLDRNRRILRMMGLYVRIENARIGHADKSFEGVADVAQQLADTIKDRVGGITRNMAELQESTAQLQQRLGETVRECQDRQSSIFSLSRECLLALQQSSHQADEQCGRFAARISERSGEIAQGIAGVVLSMQFHDITRQQIEHVRLSLGELDTLLPSDDSAGGGDPALREAVETAVMLGELHIAQLTHARDTMLKAVEDINNHLAHVRSRLGAILDDTDHLAENARQVTAILADDLSRLSDPLGAFFRVQAETSRSMGSALGKIDQILAGVTLDIEQIGSEIKTIAVNSLVKTSRMGAEGMALRVLAESIQKLSDDVCERTVLVARPLEGIASRAKAIGCVVELETSIGQAELDEMGNLLNTRRKQFAEMAREVVSLSGDIRVSLGALVEDIDRTVSSFKIDEALREEFVEAISLIESIRERARGIAPWANVTTVGERTAAKLKAESARYTMDSERDVHRRVVGNGAGAHGHTPSEKGFIEEGKTSTNGSVLRGPVESASELPDGFDFFGDPTPVSAGSSEPHAPPAGSDSASAENRFDDGIELFDSAEDPIPGPLPGAPTPVSDDTRKDPEKKEDFGDNVELF